MDHFFTSFVHQIRDDIVRPFIGLTVRLATTFSSIGRQLNTFEFRPSSSYNLLHKVSRLSVASSALPNEIFLQIGPTSVKMAPMLRGNDTSVVLAVGLPGVVKKNCLRVSATAMYHIM